MAVRIRKADVRGMETIIHLRLIIDALDTVVLTPQMHARHRVTAVIAVVAVGEKVPERALKGPFHPASDAPRRSSWATWHVRPNAELVCGAG